MLFVKIQKPCRRSTLDIGSFFPMFFPFWGFLLFMSELDRKMFLFRVSDMPEEIVKGTDAWHIIRGESTDDRI